MKTTKLTPKERELLCRAVGFILSGEWPWYSPDPKTRGVEKKVLNNALAKLGAPTRHHSR